jgi:hypothetical protein
MNSQSTRQVLAVLVYATAMALSPGARAGLIASCSLTPGGTCVPPDDAGDSAGTLLATLIDPFSFSSAGGVTHGAIKTEVFQESGGTLDFYYIIFNAPDSVSQVMGEMDMNFAGWGTSVAFRSDGANVPGFVNGNIAPSSASRDATGSTVGFIFSGIPANQRSRVVAVSTNAFYYTPGSMTVDGSSLLPTFQPSTPEPGCFVLIGGGLLTILRRRMRRNICCRAALGRQATEDDGLSHKNLTEWEFDTGFAER